MSALDFPMSKSSVTLGVVGAESTLEWTVKEANTLVTFKKKKKEKRHNCSVSHFNYQ